jgi:DNA-binding CsgD family transcriptional regulator
VLEDLDLSPLESRCYEVLVARPGRTLPALRTALEEDPRVDVADAAAVEEALAGLLDRDLVSADGGQPPGYLPAPPEVAVELLIREQQRAHAQARLYAGSLMETYRSAGAAGDLTEHLEVVRGADAVRQRFQQLQRSARDRLTVFVKGPFLTPPEQQADTERDVLRAGVEVRGIYERSALELPGDPGQVARLLAEGERARVVAEVPCKLALADDRLAMVPVDPDDAERPDAYLVHRGGFLTVLQALADALWREGAPVRASSIGAATVLLDERDAEVLTLLRAGLTDVAIARRLGTSERTVGRRVRGLMERSGAETRFQLAWRAAERRWLRDALPDR